VPGSKDGSLEIYGQSFLSAFVNPSEGVS